MSQLTSGKDFDLLLDFAFGIADRGVPLSMVVMAPDDVPESPGSEVRSALARLKADVVGRTRRSDRITLRPDGRFVALLVDCNRQGALIFADRMSLAAGAFSLMSGCTVSCGVASYRAEIPTPESLEHAAIQALEQARSEGGNRIEVADG